MVIKGPGIKGNSKNDGIAHAADLFSTMLPWQGLKYRKRLLAVMVTAGYRLILYL
jgi:hypothetical protein